MHSHRLTTPRRSVLFRPVRFGGGQRSRSSGSRSVLLALTAMLCLLAQASAIAHADFAAHGVCEHGELTELAEPSGQAPRAPAIRSDRDLLTAGSDTATA